jgi:bifunctional enzyme CysN/CysC
MALSWTDKPVVRIVAAGHVDHGKSTLIGRIRHDVLTLAGAGARDGSVDGNWAFSMDQLQEERDGMMTVDTTQAVLDTPDVRIVFIDVPGHRELIENMLTGSTRADAAILVLAADEGVREQTRRHATLLSMLGIGGVVVAVNKMDAVGHSESAFVERREAIVATLEQLGITPLAVVPVVALEGDNVLHRSAAMPWYDGPTLLELLADLRPASQESASVRFPVQDVYPRDGVEIAVGRLLSGRLAEGDTLAACVGGGRLDVREICRFPADHGPAVAGESIGLVVNGPTPRRGEVLASSDDVPVASTTLRGRVFWMDQTPLQQGERLALRLATQLVDASVSALTDRVDSATLDPLPDGTGLALMDLAVVELTLDHPVVAEPFTRVPGLGRFVLERAGRAVGMGTVA